MAFDVRLKDMPSVDESYNTNTMHKLREWTSRRSDIMTVEPRTVAVVENDPDITRVDGDDQNVVDYVHEEYDNIVGYFKEWDEPKSPEIVQPVQLSARMKRKKARLAKKKNAQSIEIS